MIARTALSMKSAVYLFAQHGQTLTGASSECDLISGNDIVKGKVSTVRLNLKEGEVSVV